MFSLFSKPQESVPNISSNFKQSQGQDGASSPLKANDKPLDVVFLQDTTGSQGPYIQAARKAIRTICDKISASGDLAQDVIRFGLIAFRDHPPQDNSYVTKTFGFTSDINVMQKNLMSLIASGGGDGPEAQTAALADALNLEWTESAVKMVILITDAPPHGIGEPFDGFDKSPDQNDPLDIARQMAERGITLFVIACEPGLSHYNNAVDFYEGLVQITSGKMFPLLMADKLGDYIVGSAVETIETEKLIGEFEQVIVDDVFEKEKSLESVRDEFQQQMQTRGVKINTIEVETIYNVTEQSMKNVSIWLNGASIADARRKVRVVGVPRVQERFGAAPAFTSRSRPSSYGSRGRGRGSLPSRDRVASSSSSFFPSVVGGELDVDEEFEEDDEEYMEEFLFPSVARGLDDEEDENAFMEEAVLCSPAMPVVQALRMAPQPVSQEQANRVIRQSIARNANVSVTGLKSKKGKVVSSEAYNGLLPNMPKDF